MGYAEDAMTWALQIANDDSHGYDQDSREGPNYDCSSFVSTAYENAGLNTRPNGYSPATSGMYSVFTNAGFSDVTSSINLSNGDGLAAGDVLLAPGSHTELAMGDGRTIGAHSNEYGGITGGKTGDQNGKEICPVNYSNHPWKYVLRPPGGGGGVYGSGLTGTNTTSGVTISTMMDPVTYTTYTASSGDTISSIANKFHTTVSMLIYLNEGVTATTDLTGKELKIPENKTEVVGSISASQAILTSHTEGVDVSAPYAVVELQTESGMLSIRQSLTVSDGTMDMDILSITTNRDMENDCPTFSITLSFRREWYEKAGSNDLVIIYMTRPPESKISVFFGLIDDVRKSTSYNSGTPQRTITITGRGFGKAFARFEVGILSELNGLSNVYGCISPALFESITKASPATVARLLTEEYIGKGCDYKFANGGKYSDYFKASYKDKPDCDWVLSDTTTFLTYEGSLWNMLKEVKNAPFNELFWEINHENNCPTLIFRYTPFNEEQWTELLRVTITDTEVITEDLGISDTETYCVYKADPETFADVLTEAILPLWFPPYYTKYGISRLSVSSKYLYTGAITSVTTTGGGASGGGNFKTYALSEAQLRGLAAVCQGEQGTAKGAAAEASLMANRVELYGGSKYPATPEGLWNYVRNSGWFAHPAGKMDSGNCDDDVYSAVKSVLVDGKRTLPAYVDEHDCFSDITYASNGGSSINVSDRSAYVKCTTKVKNRYGSSYTFYCFPDTNSDPFGYIKEENRTDLGDSCYGDGNIGSSTTTTSVPTVNKEAMLAMSKDLFNWNILNNAMENGSIVVKGKNIYQIGTRVILESTGKEYYVEGVSHNFTFFQGWTTTLTLTRGIEPTKRYAPPWNSYQQMSQDDASKILGYTMDEFTTSANSTAGMGSNPDK